jgi:RimJ/RimL family protein N-acetyltransferase
VNNPFLIGTRVYLRPLEQADASLLQPWMNDSDVTRNLRGYRPLSLRDEEAFIDSISKNEHAIGLGIAIRETDRLIGATGLHDLDFRNRHAQFGIHIGDKNEWGKGYGSEATGLIVCYAFETVNLNRVWLHVYEDNRRGIRCYEKIGFQQEGVLRQDSYRDGRYRNTIVMGILRAEWEARRE